MSKSEKTNSKRQSDKEIDIKDTIEIKENENEIQNNKNEKIENNDIASNETEEINKEQEIDKTEQIEDSENENKEELEIVSANEPEKFTIILTPKGYKYSEDGENIAYDEDAYRYNAEYEEDDIKEKRMNNLNKVLEGKIEKDEINFLQQYGDLSLAKIMSQYEKSNDIPKEYIEKIKALAKENKISIKYDLTKSSVLSRFASIFKREKALDLDQIDELKAMAYNARGYAEIKASPMTKLSFKVKDIVRGSNQKLLGEGKEKNE